MRAHPATHKMVQLVCPITQKAELHAAMATPAPTAMSAMAAVCARERLTLVLARALVQRVTRKMVWGVCQSTYKVALLAAMVTTVPQTMCAMAVVHVPVCRFLVPALQLAHPTTRPMAQAVFPTTR